MVRRLTLCLAFSTVPWGTAFAQMRDLPMGLQSVAINESLLERPARLQVQNVDLATALTRLTEASGVPVAYSPSLMAADPRSIDCECTDVTVRAALDRMLSTGSFAYREVRGEILVFLDCCESPKRRDPRIDLPISTQVRRASSALLAAAVLAVPSRVAGDAAPPQSQAQSVGSVVGTVVDARSGQPLSGLVVQIEAVKLSVLTNAQGRFAFARVPEGVHRITTSRIGYETRTQEVTVVGGRPAVVEFRLEEAPISLDELVVTSYGQSLRATKTGSVTEMIRETIAKMPITTADQALQGTMAGVQVTTTTGRPGAGVEVRVRGLGSITASNKPLYIVDGVQISDRSLGALYGGISVLGGINPQDIESIEVLKEAVATSIYGAQAANGVVLVTTRRGREGSTEWRFSAESGFLREAHTYSVLNGPQWVQMQMEAYGNRAVAQGRSRSQGEQEAVALYGSPATAPTYDWPNAVRRTGQLHEFNASVSGGTAATRFFLSGGYNYEESQQIGTSYERATIRANLEHQATDKVSILSNIGLSSSEQFGAGSAVTSGNSPLHASLWLSPLTPIYNEDGTYNINPANLKPISFNPVYQSYNEIDKLLYRQVVGSVTGNYAISSRLNFRSLWGLDYRTTRSTQFFPPDMPGLSDELTEGYTGVTNWNTNQVLSYVSSFGAERQHSLSALGGVEYRHEALETFEAVSNGFPRPSGLFHTLNLGAVPSSNTGSTGGFKMASAFGRVEYEYSDRFSLSGSLRQDGSSRFGSDYRWGLFYAGSAGWNVSSESFLEDVTWLDNLKLRLSYGTAGNSGIGDFASLTVYGSGGSYAYQPALRPTQLGSDLLTWEEARTIDVGLDWSMFDGRFRGSLDAVRRDNTDLLLSAYVPSDAGFSSVTQNSGAVRNDGIEVELGGIPYRRGDFSWETSFTWAYYKNEITELVGGKQTIGNTIRVGQPLRIFWGQRWAGVNPADGRPMWYDKDGNITYVPTSKDARVIGSPLPAYEGGWTNTFTYGPLSLSGFFAYALGGEAQTRDLGYFMDTGGAGGLSTYMLDRWQQPGDMASVPRPYPSTIPGTSGFRTFSTRWVEDASYIRLKTLRLNYELPEALTSRLRFGSGSVYVAAYNLWTYTKFSGSDPETLQLQVDLGFAQLANTWPMTRQIRFGFEVRP